MANKTTKHCNLCDEDCNNCKASENKQVALILNTLFELYGDGVYAVVQHLCPNLTCCPTCRIDDFTHCEGCGISDRAVELADSLRRNELSDCPTIERVIRDAVIGYVDDYPFAPNSDCEDELCDRAQAANAWLVSHGFEPETFNHSKHTEVK